MFLEMQNYPECGLPIISDFFYENSKGKRQKAPLSARYDTDVHIKCNQRQFDCLKCLWIDNWSTFDAIMR